MSQTFSVPKTSFVGGEWTPALYGRTDLAKYPSAVRTMLNAFAHPFGGCSNRAGFQYITESKDSNSITRLVTFQFSVVQSYVLELTDQCMRVIRDGGLVAHSPRLVKSLVNSDYQWTASGSGTNEYYVELNGGGDPNLNDPNYVFENDSGMNSGTAGSLAAGEYDYADNDSLGYSTIYVRLSDDTDPDSKANDFVEGSYHTATSLVDGSYQWTASGSGSNEFYLELSGGGDPSLSLPEFVFEDGSFLALGTLGSLSVGGYGYGDNDSLGFQTIYVRLSDETDPDSKQEGFVEASYIFELPLPYLEDDLFKIKINQSADVLYVTHPSYAPRKISRTANDNWTIESITFGSEVDTPQNLSMSGSAFDFVVTAVRADGQESVASASVAGDNSQTLTWDAVIGAEYYNVYKDRNNSGTFGWIAQANNTSFKEAAGGTIPDYDITPPINRDPFDSGDNYPAFSTFFEQRLVFFRTNNDPQTYWGSVVGDFENLNVSYPLKDDDSYKFTLNARQVNEIKWAVPLQDLIIGTTGSEWRMKSGATPTNVDVSVQSQWGVSDVVPVVIGQTVLFLDSSKRVIRDLLFSFETDGYAGNDLSLLAQHLFKDYEIVDMTYQSDPDSIVWCVRSDGVLLGMTYFKEQQIWGWHQHKTDGFFESVTSIQTDAGRTELYAVVRRQINGTFKRYIERLSDRLPVGSDFSKDVKDAFFVDSGLSLDVPYSIESITNANPAVIGVNGHPFQDGQLVDFTEIEGLTELNGKRYKVTNATTNTFTLQDTNDDSDIDSTNFGNYIQGGSVRRAVTTISGLDHLEGKAVSILADGFWVNDKTVSSGTITLDNPASRVHIGLPYESYLETLEFEIPADGGTIQDKERTIRSVLVSMEETNSIQVGPPDDDRLVEIKFRADENYDEPTKLFTGDKEVELIEPVDADLARVRIKNDAPLPFSILKIVGRVEFGDN